MKLESERSSTARDGTNSASAPSFSPAGSQSRAARSGVFSSSLEAIGERLNPSTWFSREANRTPKPAVSRLREVLDRDRALIAANPELNALDEDLLPAPEAPVVVPRPLAAAPLAAEAPTTRAPARATESAAAALPRPAVAAPATAPLAAVPDVELPPARPSLPPAPIARSVAAAPAVDEPVAPARARSAPLGAFSEAPLPHFAHEVRPAFAAPAVPAPPSPTVAPVVPSVVASRVVMVCNEPIRTRTMARLLASQGHRERALSIYEYLLSRNGNDAALRAEADELRSPPA